MKQVGFYFDLDGTLVNSEKDLFAATQFALGDNISLEHPFNEVVALGSQAMLKQMSKTPLSEDQLDKAQQIFLSYYADNIAIHTDFYEGLGNVIMHLQNSHIAHAIVTNKSYQLSLKLMQALLPDWQGVIIGDQMTPPITSKPAPDRILKAIELTHNQSGNNYYFGDYPTDMLAAKRAGCHAVACRYGFYEADNPPEQWGADIIVDTPQALVAFINDHLISSKCETIALAN